MANTLPTQAFDGQIFIDFRRIKYVFDGSNQCWRRVGTVPDIPIATEFQSGLLSAQLKQLIDGIPDNGGHFGIIAKPLLSLVPQNPNIIFKGQVRNAVTVESGTRIDVRLEERDLTVASFVGKVLIFKSGLLTKKAFLVFTNDAVSIFLEGDATSVTQDDKFEVVDLADLNPSGVLLGDIMLISESIDITCVDGEGLTINNNKDCNIKVSDNVENPPGLNFEINNNFLENLCVVLPGCKGPKGDRGDDGSQGTPGTGDGPVGDTGDPGEDAPAVGDIFSGIQIIDVDDIWDTAIVSMELDAAAGKLNVLRAKVRTPDDSTPATQVISTPIDRSIRFLADDSFEYELLMPPNGDPIGESDVDILKYPQLFARTQFNQATNIDKIKLSDLVNKITEALEDKLSEINDDYNRQLKAFIEGKDEAARNILANLAQELSECEWQLPIDFCLGLSPNDCNPDKSEGSSGFETVAFAYPFTDTLFGSAGAGTATDLGVYTILASSGDSTLNREVPVLFPKPSKNTSISAAFTASSTTLPPGGYVIQYLSGSLKSSATDFLVGSAIVGEGLEAVVVDGGTTVIQMPIPTIDFNPKEKSSVEKAHVDAPIVEKVMIAEIVGSSASITLRANMPGIGASGSITVRIIKVDL